MSATPEVHRSISREELAELPIRRYQGETVVVADAAELAAAMADIRADTVVGFDTETRPAFHKGEDYLPSLVQIATAQRVYLWQLQRLDFSAALAELLAAPGIVKTGVALAGDIAQLQRLYPLAPQALLDLGRVAKRHGHTQTGLRNLAASFLGARIPKGARTSNWAAQHLTPAQITYAATDAWIGRELYLRFQALGMLAAVTSKQQEPLLHETDC
jgi:ribonuclease D